MKQKLGRGINKDTVFLKRHMKPGVVAPACHYSIHEAEEGFSSPASAMLYIRSFLKQKGTR